MSPEQAADWGLMAAEFVTRGIDRAGVVDLVPASSVRNLLRDVPDGRLSGAEIADRTEAGYLVTGSYSTSGDQIRFDVELVNVKSGEMMRALDPVSGPTDSLEAVIAVLADRVTGAVVALLDPGVSGFIAASTTPPSLEVFRGLVASQDLFCRGRYEEAIARADQALQLAPNYAPLLASVRTGYSNLGRYAEADSVHSLIEPLRDQLTREERAMEDYMEGVLHGNPDLSTRATEELYSIDRAEYGYGAGLMAYRTNRPSDALVRLLSADIDAPCGRDWTPWWTVTASVYHLLGRFEEELALARRGLERFPNHMSILDAELRALVGLGQLAAVDSLLDVIEGLPAQEGYSPGLRPSRQTKSGTIAAKPSTTQNAGRMPTHSSQR